MGLTDFKQPSLSLALIGKAPLKSIFKGLAVVRTKNPVVEVLQIKPLT